MLLGYGVTLGPTFLKLHERHCRWRTYANQISEFIYAQRSHNEAMSVFALASKMSTEGPPRSGKELFAM